MMMMIMITTFYWRVGIKMVMPITGTGWCSSMLEDEFSGSLWNCSVTTVVARLVTNCYILRVNLKHIILLPSVFLVVLLPLALFLQIFRDTADPK